MVQPNGDKLAIALSQTSHEYPLKNEWKGLFDSYLMAQTDDYSSTYLA